MVRLFVIVYMYYVSGGVRDAFGLAVIKVEIIRYQLITCVCV